METLLELINLVTQKRVKKVELFDENSRNKSSNYYKLFGGIHSQRYRNDEEAAQDIYQCAASEKKYLILKTRLKQKLLNTLFFLDVEPSEQISDYESVLNECEKTLFHVKTLLLHKAQYIALPLIEKMLKKAQEYNLTSIEYECAIMMYKHYAEVNLYKDFLLYKAMAERIEQKLMAENNAEKLLVELKISYYKSKVEKEGLVKMAEEFSVIIRRDLQKFNSDKLKDNYLKIKTIQARLLYDFPSVLKYLDEREEHLKNSAKYRSQSQIDEIQIEKMNAYLHLKDFEGAIKYRNQINITSEREVWFILQEYSLLLALHTNNFVDAAQVFQQTLEHSKFRTMPSTQKERWLVFQAYLHYVYKSQKIKAIRLLTQNAKIEFKLSDFLEIKPEFSKSNRGLNMSILTIQLLFYLEKMDTEGMSECIQSLEPYSRRYPKRDASYRSECFIGMLTEMWKEDFRYYQTRKNAEKYYEELNTTPFEYLGGNKYLEVLPYEVIWGTILEKLKQFKYG
jgi:hypothetical protein